MTEHALAGNRIFAIAHSEDEGKIAPIGGLGVIRACVKNPDGSSNLVLQGLSRVEFSAISLDPRPHADIRVLRDAESERDLSVIREKILTTCEELLEDGLETPTGFSSYLRSSISNSAFSDLIASTLIPDSSDRRLAFEALDIESRMSLILGVLTARAESP